MTFEDYQRNLKGVNDGSNFKPEYLVRILRLLPKHFSHSFHSEISLR